MKWSEKENSRVEEPFYYFKETLDYEMLFQLMPEHEKEFILSQLQFISDRIMRK